MRIRKTWRPRWESASGISVLALSGKQEKKIVHIIQSMDNHVEYSAISLNTNRENGSKGIYGKTGVSSTARLDIPSKDQWSRVSRKQRLNFKTGTSAFKRELLTILDSIFDKLTINHPVYSLPV